MRAKAPGVMSTGGSVWLLEGRDGACRLEGDHAALVLAVLDAAEEAMTRDDLVRAIADSAGVGLDHRAAIDEAVSLLLRAGALEERSRDPAPARPPGLALAGRVLLCVTGAIASVQAPSLVQRLLSAGHHVRVAMTPSARRFIAPRALEAMTHEPVLSSMWPRRGRLVSAPAPHIELAEWADVVVVHPCSATSLSRIARGDASELVSAAVTATRAPVLLAPSMNVAMWRSPAVMENVERLEAQGRFIAHPGDGHEVAHPPGERLARPGVAAAIDDMARYVAILMERVAAAAPRLATRAEWDGVHARLGAPTDGAALDPDLASVIADLAPAASRVLDVGAGDGRLARAIATLGHAVVATDFSREAVRRAHAAAPDAPVTWLVDDMTDTALSGHFDVAVDRGTFGCVHESRRARYVRSLASLLTTEGCWVVKVHAAPLSDVRAYGFTEETLAHAVASCFEVVSVAPSNLAFGEGAERPALTFVLRKRKS